MNPRDAQNTRASAPATARAPARLRLILASLLVLASHAAPACRYSVRDTGFVDLDQPPWSLRLEAASASTREAWIRAANRLALDTNLRLVAAEATNTPAGPPTLVALAPDQRTLPLPIPAELRPSDTPDPARLAAFLDNLALSPFRDRLHGELIQSFAVLVLLEGTQPGPTAQARRTAEEAIRAFTPLLRSLPKPVDTPPRLVALSPAELPNERLFVWSLGTSPDPRPEPRLAFLYGRGRRIGEILDGPLITRTAIAERLTLIGQDCECDLDRSWLQGPVFPARWDSSRQSAAARALGFDPENPLVRSEVSRIVLRGPLPGQARRPVARTGFDALALGYREVSLDTPEDSATATDAAETEEISPAPAPLPTSTPPPVATATPPAPVEVPEPPSWPWLALAGITITTVTAGLLLLLRHFRTR